MYFSKSNPPDMVVVVEVLVVDVVVVALALLWLQAGQAGVCSW